MKILDKFNRSFGFTQTESRVVLVLIAAFLLGIGVRIFREPGSSRQRYDYSSLDSEFIARSAEFAGTDSIRGGDPEGSARNPGSGRISGTAGTAVVNINLASETELSDLPGIGPAIAKRIVAFRTENGPFRSIEDLRNVKGIGAKKFERLAPFCTLGK